MLNTIEKLKITPRYHICTFTSPISKLENAHCSTRSTTGLVVKYFKTRTTQKSHRQKQKYGPKKVIYLGVSIARINKG